MRGVGEIFNVHLMRVALAASGPNGDEGEPVRRRQGPCRESRLGFYLVTCIDKCVNWRVFRQKGWPVGGLYKLVDALHHATGVNPRDAITHCQHLGLPDGFGDCVDLSVHIGFSHVVHVDQCDSAHPAASEGLCGPRPDAADADHDYVGGTNPRSAGNTIQTLKPAKTAC